MRKPVVMGNWKMNKTIKETLEYINSVEGNIDNKKVDAVICPSYLSLKEANQIAKEKGLAIGSQNVYFEDKGAYTGEVSGEMLKELGVEYCIVGHSERRKYFKETDEEVNKKARRLLSLGIKPVICIGETLDQREDGDTIKVVSNQLKKALQEVPITVVENVIIAYEPVWAIGTGKTATKEQAEEVCVSLRQILALIYDNKDIASRIRILYGGSVNIENCKEIFSMPNIDGALVGGASLTPDFVEIIKSAY